MNKEDRYDVSRSIEAQFEQGSNDAVLKNKLGIVAPAEMDRMEAKALAETTGGLVQEYDIDHRFSADDVRYMHKKWLGGIYEWAGRYRTVDISKGEFPFATAAQVPRLMDRFETEQLMKYTPCRFESRGDIIKALAEVHTELILIHPFREGNGRCSRLLAGLMALQAGLPALEFDLITGAMKQDYFAAVQAGLDRDYKPMESLFAEIIEASVQALSRQIQDVRR